VAAGNRARCVSLTVRLIAAIVTTLAAVLAGASGSPGAQLSAADPMLAADGVMVHFTSRGAGVALARLPGYPATVGGFEPYVLLGANRSAGSVDASLATISVELDQPDATIELNHPWTVVGPTDGAKSVSFRTTASRDDEAVLAIDKTYRLTGRRFELAVEHRIENLSDQSVTFSLIEAGPAGMPREDARGDYRSLYVARKRKDQVRVRRIRHASKSPRLPDWLADNADKPIQWWAVANKYFAAIVVPAAPAGLDRIILEPGDGSDLQSPPFTCRWASDKITLSPGGEVTLSYWLYLGPQDREFFAGQERYAQLEFGRLIDAHGSMCTFAALGRGMSWLLRTMVRMSPWHNYGLAILLLAVGFRILLGPLSRYGFRATARSQLIGRKLRSKIAQLKEQFGEDKKRLNEETLKLYKAEGVTPPAQMGGCLPILVQIPIWGALWTAINTTIALRGAPFVLWITDLTGPDALIRFSQSYTIPILGKLSGPITSLNVLPILLGLLAGTWQLLRRSSLDANNVKKRRSIGPLVGAALMILILYNAPSGLTLYIMASSTINGIQRWQITKKLQETMFADTDAAVGQSPPSKTADQA